MSEKIETKNSSLLTLERPIPVEERFAKNMREGGPGYRKEEIGNASPDVKTKTRKRETKGRRLTQQLRGLKEIPGGRRLVRDQRERGYRPKTVKSRGTRRHNTNREEQ